MYQPSVFQEERLETLHALIGAHPLGTLITSGTDGLIANLVKISQNRSIADRQGVYAALQSEGINDEMAKLVAQNK